MKNLLRRFSAGALAVFAFIGCPVATGSASASINAALALNGAVAGASSQYAAAPYDSSSLPPAAAINGDRKGANWNTGGIWHDATANAFPDSLQINFNGSYSIGEIDVFPVQDNFGAPADPTPAVTFTQYGLAAFQVQYWTGSSFADVPGGTVTGNNVVWRKFTFSSISTDRIRVLVNTGLGSFSRIAEVEAWTAAGQTTYQLTGTVSLNGAPLAAAALSATGGGETEAPSFPTGISFTKCLARETGGLVTQPWR